MKSFNSPRVLLQLESLRVLVSDETSFNSPRVLLQPRRASSSCRSCRRFNSPRVLLQPKIPEGTVRLEQLTCFNSPRVLLQPTLTTLNRFTEITFQFSKSLIATTLDEIEKDGSLYVSILQESYCNRDDDKAED